ncbi:hypothetical protein ABID23_000231 [Bartonella silvatica]|uniref:Uncharacterized protein n=1 Tax=Bartonella silvatica TaxID=357760 RepID=A0ABV2HF44_9HYPH
MPSFSIVRGKASWYYHYIFQSPMLPTTLALRWVIRGIFSPFLYSFSPHASPACDVQADNFY